MMPYIKKDQREELKKEITKSVAEIQSTNTQEDAESKAYMLIYNIMRDYIRGIHPVGGFLWGEDDAEGILNYTCTEILNRSMCVKIRYIWINRVVGIVERVMLMLSQIRYWDIEGVRYGRALGILRCMQLEFYARRARPYEDLAIEKNGDLEYYTAAQPV